MCVIDIASGNRLGNSLSNDSDTEIYLFRNGDPVIRALSSWIEAGGRVIQRTVRICVETHKLMTSRLGRCVEPNKRILAVGSCFL
jgi:hypothetical protein